MTQLFLAFIEGIGLIASPCILPVLPLVLAAGADGGKSRPLGIIFGFIGVFTIFALLSRSLINFLGIDPALLRHLSLFLLTLLGAAMIVPAFSSWLMQRTEGLARWSAQKSQGRGEGFGGGLAIGGLIALVWTPCAGPIMAAAVVQIVQAGTSATAGLTIALFAAGAAIPMLAIALFGRAAMDRFSFFKKHSEGIRQFLGAIIVAVSLLIWTGLDEKLLMPELSVTAAIPVDGRIHKGLENPYPAPEIAGVAGWINSEPLTLQQLRGKVVLVDFWTYSCINCIRTLPYLKAWYGKYKDEGFVILGVHSPEFAFEKDKSNVEDAAQKHGLSYPIALDNDFATWDAYDNRYWPAHYLIDREGRIVYTHFGEGEYAVTEHNIRTLLGSKGETAEVAAGGGAAEIQTPETYLGYDRARHFSGDAALRRDSWAAYNFPGTLGEDAWALRGKWRAQPQNITAGGDAALRLRFRGGKVFLVMGTENKKPLRVKVLLDGKPVTTGAGADVANGHVIVAGERLYELINLGAPGEGLLELQTESYGLMAYAFTFGR